MYGVLTLNKGSDLNFQVFWPDAPGSTQGKNLTDYTVDVYQAHTALAPYLSLAITDAAGGIITGRIEWNDALPVGEPLGFIVRIQRGADSITLPTVKVLVV